MNTENRICVVMAGGSGERFWPLSRRLRPKQLLRLGGSGHSMLEDSVNVIAPLVPRERTFVATSRALEQPIAAAGIVPVENVLGEPCKRNTAGCLAYVAAELMARYGEDAASLSLAILTADHQIGDHPRFLETIETAFGEVEREPVLGVIGIRPTRPETGYGYIEIAESASTGANTHGVFPVARFREKPDAATAAEFLASGRFLWNSGMFFWRLGTFLDELDVASPAHADAVRAMARARAEGHDDEVDRVFGELPDISIDFALMEKARRVVVTPADFPWDDVGSWDALDRTQAHDAQGNVAIGDPVLIDTQDCVVYNEPGGEKMAVAAIGVENLAIIVCEDGVLVTPKDRAQEVRKAVDLLKKRGARQL